MSNKPITDREFRNWLEGQKDSSFSFSINRNRIVEDENEKYIGKMCKSKVSESKLLDKIDTDEDPVSVVSDFLENGATVLSFEGKKVLLETESGTFYVPKFCVKFKK